MSKKLIALSILGVLLFATLPYQTAWAQGSIPREHEPSQEVINKLDEATSLFNRNNTNADSIRKAIKLTDQAIAMDSDYVDTYCSKMYYLCLLDSIESAITCLESYLRHHPDQPYVIQRMGILYDKAGRKDVAKRYYETAIKLFRQNEAGGIDLTDTVIDRLFTMILLGQSEQARAEYKSIRNKLTQDPEKLKVADQWMEVFGGMDRDDFIKNLWTPPLAMSQSK